MTVYKRSKSWTAQISWYTYDQGTKKRHYKTQGGFSTKKEAQLWEAAQKVKSDNFKVSDKNPLFVEYFWTWAKTYRLAGKQKNTIKRYRYARGVLDRYFNGVRINNLNKATYQRFLNSYGANHSKNTVQRTVRLFKACLAEAYDEGLISRNYAKNAQITWNNDCKRETNHLNVSQLQALTSAVKSKLNPRYVSRYIILTAIYTGMRIGEILALNWTDIDQINSTIQITKTWDLVHKELKEPKTASSRRLIKVPASLLKTLGQLRSNGYSFIFAKPDGQLPSDDAVNHTLRAIMRRIGLNTNGYTVHSLRHAHVAYLYYKGVDWYKISKRLGHSSVSITMDVYSYLVDEMDAKQDQQVLDALDALNSTPRIRAV